MKLSSLLGSLEQSLSPTVDGGRYQLPSTAPAVVTKSRAVVTKPRAVVTKPRAVVDPANYCSESTLKSKLLILERFRSAWHFLTLMFVGLLAYFCYWVSRKFIDLKTI